MMIAAATAQPVLVLTSVLVGVTVLMFLIRGLGLFLAHTHPVSPRASAASALGTPALGPASLREQAPGVRDPELVAVIAAATAVAIGQPHRILAVSEPKKPSVESLMQVWSWEGRRQIYSSHRVR